MIKLRHTPLAAARKSATLALGMAAALLSSCSSINDALEELQKEKDKNNQVIPGQIIINQEQLYPEGVALDQKNRRFLVSSLTRGTIGAVAYNGTYTPFIQDPALKATIGLKIDEARRRVLVAVSDPRMANVAGLGIYDLNTAERLHFVDLLQAGGGQRNFANDIATDPQGNAYVTNSFSPIIYKVDRDGNASVLLQENRFATNPGEFGFNGIVYDNNGFLIVAFSKENALFRIPVNNPSAYSRVELSTQLMGPDGLLLSKDGKQLVVVNNAGGAEAGKVLSFTSDDQWKSGRQTESFATGAVFPTTATSNGKDVFVLYAYLNRLFNPALPPQNTFTIQKVPFNQNRPF